MTLTIIKVTVLAFSQRKRTVLQVQEPSTFSASVHEIDLQQMHLRYKFHMSVSHLYEKHWEMGRGVSLCTKYF